MKLIGVISTAVLSLALGVAAPAFAQEQHEQEEQKAKPAQQEEKKAQPAAKPAQQEERKAQPAAKPEAKPAAQEEKNTKPEEKNAHQAKPEQQAQRASGNGGGRIPADKFQANFGQGHRFHVSQGDYNNRRFQYGGYSFGFVDVWPSNWLYTQDVYVIEINGVYYLCNASFPGVNLALSFTP
jgi:hypothetical protein